MPEPEAVTYVLNSKSAVQKQPGDLTRQFSPLISQSVHAFHQNISRYKPTPLVSLPNLAQSLRLRNVWIKDESRRFNLNAFKVLGASYALTHALGARLGIRNEVPSFEMFRSQSARSKLRDITVITATDGNHGRAVAWSAKQMGCNAVIYVPINTSPARIRNIRAHGAAVRIIEGNYDAAVRAASSDAEQNDWLLIQDSSWEGYEQIPLRIMQGYLTIAVEAVQQMNGCTPTHVFLQCGVGSFAASMQAYFVERYGGNRCPFFAVVEPARAACFYQSMKEYTGSPSTIRGNLDTIMAGLACGEPSMLAWEILKNYADAFFSCRDSIAIKGMQTLGNPVKGDPQIISGESGAVTLGLLVHLRTSLRNDDVTEALRLNSQSRVLLVSTEGDTDPEAYRKIVQGE